MGLLYTVIIGAVLRSMDSCDCEALRAKIERLELELAASRELDVYLRRERGRRVVS